MTKPKNITSPPDKGRISIYTGDGELIESCHYYSLKGRKTIMEKWEDEYGGMEGSYFQIYPHALDKDVPKVVKKSYIRKDLQPTVKLIRPPAIYDNQKSLYDIAR